MIARKAFTLVEILIVVVILGIIAAVVIPGFSNASAKSRASMLADDLRIMRTQIQVYRGQHTGVAPGYPAGDPDGTPTEALFLAQVTLSSNADGATAAVGTSGYPYGPYFSRMPENPFNGKRTVQIIGDSESFPSAGDDSHGWVFKPDTQQIAADSPGTDESSVKYFDY